MAGEADLVSMAQAFTGLPMGELIGGPLMAACDANNKMAMTQANYILQTGFSYVPPDPNVPDSTGTYKVVEIDMELTRPIVIPGNPNAQPPTDPSIENVTTIVKVPLISILPLPSLGIDKVGITFDMEVKSSYGKQTTTEQQKQVGADTSFEAKFGSGPFSVSIKGNASYSQTDKSSTSENIQRSNSANYHVEVSASQQPQPPGLALIMQEFAKNIGPFVMPTANTNGNQNMALLSGGMPSSDPRLPNPAGSGPAGAASPQAFAGSARL